MGSCTFCDRMTHNFAQDAFFNKHHRRKMYLTRRLLRMKKQNQNKQRDYLRFLELDRLVRMNI